MLIVALLVSVGFVAGFIDSIGGGGGLLTLPMLLMLGLPGRVALGTNKGQAIFGMSMALTRFAHSPLLDRRRILVSFAFGVIGSVIGVLSVVRLSETILRIVVIILLLAGAIALLIQPASGRHEPTRERPAWMAALVAVTMGFYDGFFGPGVGIFLILCYSYLWREPLDRASANAKVVNCASGLAAAITFGASGLIVWPMAIPMAIGQVAGGFLGAHTVIRSGRRIVRVFVVVMAMAQVAYLSWRTYVG